MSKQPSKKNIEKLLFIGGGKICEAIVSGIVGSGVVGKNDVVISEPDNSRCEYIKKTIGVSTTSDNKQHLSDSTIIVLAVKPGIWALC